jgi:hypothetical protein
VRKKKTLAQYQKEAPEIPSNTCPYIDFIQEIYKEVTDDTDCPLTKHKMEVADSLLEYVRASNESLRRNSYYWYTKFKSKYK